MADVIPGTTSKGMPALDRAMASSPPRPENEGVAALQPDDAPALRCLCNEQGIDVGLASALAAGRLSRVDHIGVHAGAPQEPLVYEPVVDHHVSRLQQLEAPGRYEPGIAGSCPDEVDDAGHCGHGSSNSAASASSSEASSSPSWAREAAADTSRRNTCVPSGAATMP